MEREIKLRYARRRTAREAILAAGATPFHGRRLQEDALLDTDDEQLRRRRCILRVRTENGKSRLTFKGPVQPAIMKVREEVETWSVTARCCCASSTSSDCTSGSGTRSFARSSRSEDVIIAIDETPVGVFVEIEGGEEGITQMAAALGRRAVGLRRSTAIAGCSCRARQPRLDRPGHAVRIRAGMTRPPALVLTAGLGTRLRPLTHVRAKAAVPVNGEPLVRRVARWLAVVRHPRARLQPAPSPGVASRPASATAPHSAFASAIRGNRPFSGRQAARATRCRCSPTAVRTDF